MSWLKNNLKDAHVKERLKNIKTFFTSQNISNSRNKAVQKIGHFTFKAKIVNTARNYLVTYLVSYLIAS